MIGKKRVLAIVPARGGSKGIPLKNLRPVGGVPMVARVGHLVRGITMIDRTVVSTDHEEIARVAEESGLAAPFRRPVELFGDCIGDIGVLTHALNEMEGIDSAVYDIVVMLQPTSPLRRPEDVVHTIEKLVQGDWDAVWTVSVTDPKNHPLKQLVLTDGTEKLNYYDPAGAAVVARQQMAPLYHRNGVAYAFTRACLLEQKSIMGTRSAALILEDTHVSIDTPSDLDWVEFILSRRPDAPK